jgi:hypothetical protein
MSGANPLKLTNFGTYHFVWKLVYSAGNEGSVAMVEGEEMFVLEQDQGDGWTRVRKHDNSEGFVPTSYIQCHFYDQDEV